MHYFTEAMWFLLAVSCVVAAAQPKAKSNWNQADQWGQREEQNVGNAPVPNLVRPLSPNEREQNSSKGSPSGHDQAFTTQKEEVKGFESVLTRAGDGPWNRWKGAGKPQKIGRAGRPSYKVPMKPSQAPADGAREESVNPLFGKPLSPNMMENRQFIPVFKADNVTLQNMNAFHLKEGENVFLLPKGRGLVQQAKKAGLNIPLEMGGQGFYNYGPQPYVRIIYRPNATPRISFEYGLTQLLPSFR
ncbi:hypothetical protein DNTS_027912 [Danionella cerebrum]|uniref:Uncharacterized protein n=1 Tax=Danionella cerebrum TaxID=2873325 RepID=A0A553PZ01_9TELE|nr:hypothetical protein DNTS_027912 [Danionella translucida]